MSRHTLSAMFDTNLNVPTGRCQYYVLGPRHEKSLNFGFGSRLDLLTCSAIKASLNDFQPRKMHRISDMCWHVNIYGDDIFIGQFS